MERRPDILLVVLDTMRRDRLSSYGNPRATSPEFDAFAASATVFERAVSPAQWTVPAHASLFTGLYTSEHGVTQGYSVLPDRIPTLAELLRGAGYHTVAFCNNPLVGVLNNGLQRGFDSFYNYAGASPDRPADRLRGPLRRALVSRFRRTARRIENRFAHSDRLFQLSMHPWVVPLWVRGVNYKGSTERSISDLLAYVEGRRQRPLFLFLNLMGSHLPYRPSQEVFDRVAPGLRDDRAACAFVRRLNTDAARWQAPPEGPLRDWERAALEGFYDAEVACQDEHLGRLLRGLGLEGTGALEDALVILVADHGEGLGDHGFFGHTFVVHQELVHVPLVVSGREFLGGRRVRTNVSTRRVFHTVLEAAGVGRSVGLDGDPAALGLERALDGADPEGGVAYTEAIPAQTIVSLLRRRNPSLFERLALAEVRRGVYAGDWKLVLGGDRVEGLYALDRDPAEEEDVSVAHPNLAAELHEKVRAFVARCGRAATSGGAQDGVSAEAVEHLRGLGYID